MTIREKQAVFAIWLAKLIMRPGEPIVITCLYRTEEEQKALVAAGKSKTMKSKHLQGLAVDIAFLPDIMDDGVINRRGEAYRELGEYWESLGGKWGGRFGVPVDHYPTEVGWDAGHFEFRD